MTLKLNFIGHLGLTEFGHPEPCIVIMVLIGQPLIYSTYPYSYPRQTNSYLTAVT